MSFLNNSGCLGDGPVLETWTPHCPLNFRSHQTMEGMRDEKRPVGLRLCHCDKLVGGLFGIEGGQDVALEEL